MSSPFGSASVTTVSGTLLTNPVAALLSGTKWGGAVGAGAIVSFSFPGADAVWYFNATGGYSDQNEPVAITDSISGGLDPAARDAVRGALAEWATIANLGFYEITEDAGNVGDVRVAYTDMPSLSDWWGWSYVPTSNWAPGGDVWVNKNAPSTGWASGSFDFLAILHELGHALGLKHPFDGVPRLSGEYDSVQYTLMSYNAHRHSYLGLDIFGTKRYVQASTPMLYDIAAIQYLYGANTTTRSGDDVYRFDPGVPMLVTIWDAAGNDTISAVDYMHGVKIDLRPGQFSSLRVAPVVTAPDAYDGTDNLAIAFGAWIENAIGGSGNDSLLGNALDNVLEGGAGNDLLSGYAGNDTASYAGAVSAVTVTLTTSGAQSTGVTGRDTLVSIENLRGSAYADRLAGNSGSNILDGGTGADTMSGGSGADTYHVDQSGDVIREGRSGGLDTVISSVSYTLGAWTENLWLDSANPISGAGNALNNILYAGSGDNLLFGAAGVDTVDYRYATAGVQVSLAVTGPQQTVGSGSDTLLAVEGLSGSPFGDQLSGNRGDNRLSGGGGNDTLTGGSGNDVFVFDTLPETNGNIDLITDFVPGGYQTSPPITTVYVSPMLKLLQSYLAGLAGAGAATFSGGARDQIHLENAVFTALPVVGTLPASALASGSGLTAAVDANDRVIYDVAGGGLYYDSDGSGAEIAVQFAWLAPGLDLSSNDFRVI